MSTREASNVAGGKRQKRSRSSSLPDAPISVDEAADLYPGEWILMKLTAYDENRLPAAGWILAHGKTRRSINKTFVKALEEDLNPALPYYIFQGYHYLRTGERWQEVLDKLAYSEDNGVWDRQ